MIILPKTIFHLDNKVNKTADGLAPQLPNENTTTKFLRQDGEWETPPDTKVMHGTFSTGQYGAINLSLSSYIAISASKYNYVLVPYIPGGAQTWFIRDVTTGTPLANVSDVEVCYISK